MTPFISPVGDQNKLEKLTLASVGVVDNDILCSPSLWTVVLHVLIQRKELNVFFFGLVRGFGGSHCGSKGTFYHPLKAFFVGDFLCNLQGVLCL